jgi:ABC-type transport system substrate-binding protein
MNKKVLYAIIAVIVVVILIVAVLEIIVVPPTKATMTVSTSAATAIVGQNITFDAFISGGTPSSVVFNFGDGVLGTAIHLTGNEYSATHSYSSAGKDLVTASATVNGKNINNFQSIIEETISPASVNPTVASEITSPSIITSSQIYSPGSTVSLTAFTSEPPTATNWTIGYYIWNFGDKTTHTDYTVFNTSSGSFMASNTSHLYSTAGIYTVTLGVITFNATGYVPTTYTINGVNYTYYPLSDLTSILSASGSYYNTTYVCTIVINSTAKLLQSTVISTNPHEIIATEVQAGGPYSLDPAIDYEPVGMEIVVNVYETLIAYNGSSTTEFVPLVATEVPTLANGGISANYLNYTFHIRSGLKFSNGDPLTAWDAYTSFVRTLLFVAGSPSPPGWILAQDLLPGDGFATNATSYQNITNIIAVNNATQTITFHLFTPDPAFFTYIADVEGGSITDYNWLVAHGAGITFTPTGFAAYTNQGNEVDYNTYVEYNTLGSGPYMIKNYIIGQSVVLTPNPYYTPVPGVYGYDHAANDTIFIQWEKDPSTALLIAESGQTDIITNLPSYDYPIMTKLQSEGKINITIFPSFDLFYFDINCNINTTMLPELGSGYTVPQYYFANLDVRRAWAYAFNYTNYIDNLLGNSRYGGQFGFTFSGFIPEGMIGYMNSTQLEQAGANVPIYNLAIAKQYMEESGLYNISVNIPIIVRTGFPSVFAAAEDWATTMNSIDPHVQASALYMSEAEGTGYQVPYQDPLTIFMGSFFPDFPFPSDYIVAMFQESIGGAMYGWTPQGFAAAGYPAQANEDALLNQYIADAEQSGNETLVLSLYEKANVLSTNLTLQVYFEQANMFWFYSSTLRGVQYEKNPVYGGEEDTIFIYLTK